MTIFENLTSRWPTCSHAVVRKKLADADPPPEELLQRIRSWDVAMTRLKTENLLAELPTKRLLMKYAQGFVDRADPPGNLQVSGYHVNRQMIRDSWGTVILTRNSVERWLLLD